MPPSFSQTLIRTPSPTSIFAREADSKSTASAYPSPNLQYLDVGPLPEITLFRGTARVRVNPYSALHARLTGRQGTPTPISTNPAREAKARQNMQGVLADRGDSLRLEVGCLALPDSLVGATPSVTVVSARLLATPGDAPEEAELQSLRPPRSGRTATPALNDAFGGPGPRAAVGWIPTAPVTPVEGVAAAQGEFDWGGVRVEPDEARHRNFRRSPYQLRFGPLRRAQMYRLARDARAIGQPLDRHYLQRAGIKRFNPGVPLPPTNTRLLYLSASVNATGITLCQFGRIFKKCIRCNRYIFVDRKREHSCDGPGIDVTSNRFHVAISLFNDFCPGLTSGDIEAVFEACDTCERVYVRKYGYNHTCPDGSDDFVQD